MASNRSEEVSPEPITVLDKKITPVIKKTSKTQSLLLSDDVTLVEVIEDVLLCVEIPYRDPEQDPCNACNGGHYTIVPHKQRVCRQS
jgi:hypothetical protein